ncbi:MAG: hypothetical protein E7266_07590 [Lachnospiraceae bacterium]|nr:hypothetical protein [Lachnospiraceae bacterium]
MAKNMKKLLALLLVVALAATCFTACSGDGKKKVNIRDIYTDVDINLSYAFWEDGDIFEKIYQDWLAKYPNITIDPVEFPTGTFTESLKALFAANDAPDIFGIIGGPDFAIENGMLLDMTLLWENDDDAKKVIRGINDFRIGYFSTDYKWATPIKFYPAAAFINKNLIIEDLNMEMPDPDWTWEDYEEFITDVSDGKKVDGYKVFGTTGDGGCLTVTWYPIMSDGECIGEFGWTEKDGGSYDMENWAVGMNLQAQWAKDGIYYEQGNADYRTETYGSADIYPQDQGHVAVECCWWYTFARYFDNDQGEQKMLENGVVYVPYMQPHLESVAKEDYTYIATMDIGGINSSCGEYAVEAYEALKYFTWGAEGWKAKLKYYPEMLEDGVDYGVAGAKYGSNFPINLDDEVWEAYRALWAGADDPYGRGEYFDDFFDRVKAARWTCLGAPQIPGFETWLNDFYFLEDFEGSGQYAGIEAAVLQGGVDASAHYQELQEAGNAYFEEKIGEIEVMLQ